MLKRKLEDTTQAPLKKRKLNDDEIISNTNNNDEINEEDEYENEEKKLDQQKAIINGNNNENHNNISNDNDSNIDSNNNESKKDKNKKTDSKKADGLDGSGQEFTLKADSFVFNETSMNAFDGFDGQGFGALTESNDTIDNENNDNNDKNKKDDKKQKKDSKNEFDFQFKFDSWGTGDGMFLIWYINCNILTQYNDKNKYIVIDNGGITFNFEDFDPKKYGSESVEYNDQNNFETNKPVAVLQGEELDSGDKNDDNLYKVNCTIYKLINDDDGTTRYQEKGKGILNVNTYKDNDNKKTKGRLLCRRDKILSNILNIGITKKLEFNLVNNSFIRFSVLQLIDTTNDTNNNNDDDINEDIDLKVKQQLTTYLIKVLFFFIHSQRYTFIIIIS